MAVYQHEFLVGVGWDACNDEASVEVEELGDEASSVFSKLQIVEIPDDVIEDYMIDD